MLVVALAVAALLTACGKTKAGPPVDTAAPVVVAATQRDIPLEVKAVGTVEAYSNVQVKSMIAGEIPKEGFTEGQDVRRATCCS